MPALASDVFEFGVVLMLVVSVSARCTKVRGEALRNRPTLTPIHDRQNRPVADRTASTVVGEVHGLAGSGAPRRSS